MVTVRVYGIYINALQQVLVSDELIKGELYCKFPGGGLEFGEGTRECLIREFKEEMNADVVVKKHIYSTDFFVESAFAKGTQVMSIYYEVDFLTPQIIPNDNVPPSRENFGQNNPHLQERHRMVDISRLSIEHFQLPIDKVVAQMIKEQQQ